MNTALWIIQGVLALGFAAAGCTKLLTPKPKLVVKMAWAKHFAPGSIKSIGLAELLGAIGLVVPWATMIEPRLTPIAASALVIVMAGAVATHVRVKDPFSLCVPSIVLGTLSAIVALGRFGVV